MGLAVVGLLGATLQAFAAALQGVATAGVVSDLPFTSPAAPGGKVACLSLLHLRFACGVTVDNELTPIWEAVAQGQGKTEGLDTLTQVLMRGLPYCRRVFGGRAHFSASLLLLALVKNVSLVNLSLDPACARGGGVHAVAFLSGYSRGIHPWGCGGLPPSPAARPAPGVGGLSADGRKSPPGCHPVRGRGAS